MGIFPLILNFCWPILLRSRKPCLESLCLVMYQFHISVCHQIKSIAYNILELVPVSILPITLEKDETQLQTLKLIKFEEKKKILKFLLYP